MFAMLVSSDSWLYLETYGIYVIARINRGNRFKQQNNNPLSSFSKRSLTKPLKPIRIREY